MLSADPPLVILRDGVRVDSAAATVSVFDRGFMYGDLVFEVFRTYGGQPFALEAHLLRFRQSAHALGFELPGQSQWAEEVVRACRTRSPEESSIRLIATRGQGLGLNPEGCSEPARFVIASALPAPMAPEAQGLTACFVAERGLRARPEAKAGDYLSSVLHTREARARGAHEALLVAEDGQVWEGASSNLFAVRMGALWTPPCHRILNGVTRQVVIELASEIGVGVVERPLSKDLVNTAEEVFITSSLREVAPVVALDGVPVGGGQPGPLTQVVKAAFAQRVRVPSAPSTPI